VEYWINNYSWLNFLKSPSTKVSQDLSKNKSLHCVSISACLFKSINGLKLKCFNVNGTMLSRFNYLHLNCYQILWDSALWGFNGDMTPLGNLYLSIRVDVLHQSDIGIFKMLVDILHRLVSPYVVQVLDDRLMVIK